MTEIEHLNVWLKDQGGSCDGKPLYRLVWSDSIFENRFGTFRDFTESGLFIREVTETRLCRKYSYIHERWILEKWAPGNLTANRETPDALNGDYIPVYVFADSKGEYLAPNQKVLRFILSFMRGSIPKDEEVPQELLEEKEIQQQIDTILDDTLIRTTGSTRNSVAYTQGLKRVSDFKERNGA